MEISGLSALDPRVAATEKFISDKNIPAEQVPAFLMSMGADPRLAGLVLRYQRLKSAGAQGEAKPPQSTVAQDIEAQQSGIAAPMAPPPNRDQGVGSLPAPVMDRAKFAGGGIVAFQNGGDAIEVAKKQLLEMISEAESQGDFNKAIVLRGQLRRVVSGNPESMAPPEPRDIGQTIRESVEARAARDFPNRQPIQLQSTTADNSAAAAATPRTKRDWANAPQQNRRTAAATAPVPDVFAIDDISGAPAGTSVRTGGVNEGIKILRDQVNALKNVKPEDREARYRAAGIEDMTPKQLAKIEDRISKLSGDKKRDAYMALAQAGFKMAAAASRPGASLLGAFGEGASEGAKMMADVNKEYRALQSDLEDKVMALQRYQQERKEGRIDRDIEFERELAKEIRGTEAKIGELAEESRRFDVTTQLTREQIEASKDPIKQLKRAYISTRDPRKKEQILAEMVKLNEVDTRAFIEQLKAEAALERQREKDPLAGLGMGSSEGWGEVRVK
jgi:hypothetical protein